ncbi:MAG: Hint domain-containing protein [Rhodobacteraceae bacterium]|nr:Hint domain-containing protein [Paracoccaceae bacterium]
MTSITTRTAEVSGAIDGMLITGQGGFISGTHVASNLGWRTVETLSVGDKVLTFDRGMQTVIDIQTETLFAPEHALSPHQCPVLVPEGALNNRRDMWLMPDQGILVESDAAIDAMGDPFAVIPASALKGFKGIGSASGMDRLKIITLAFTNDEVVYVEGGLLGFCPRPRSILMGTPDDEGELYDVLDAQSAKFLVECLIEEDDEAALVCDPDQIAGVIAHGRVQSRLSPAYA